MTGRGIGFAGCLIEVALIGLMVLRRLVLYSLGVKMHLMRMLMSLVCCTSSVVGDGMG